MSVILKPVFLSNKSHAFDGAIAKSMGFTPASSKATILANGVKPLYLAACSSIKTSAAAPSFILDAFAAVIVPVLENAGFSFGNFSGRNFLHSSS